MKNIAVLTCGRSDFSIYLPLLKELDARENISLTIIAFGSHTSHYHGYTVSQIREEKFKNIINIDSTLADDKPDSIAISMGLTSIRLSEIWRNNKFDYVFCLGDRYEMFAAVSSAVMFNLKIVHLHGGEKTLGALDNKFRHAITSMSNYHFTSCKEHLLRVKEIIDKEFSKNVYNIGSLSLHNIKSNNLLTKNEFYKTYNIDISKPTALVTYHPETVKPEVNEKYLNVLFAIFEKIKEQILITMPNNDTMGSYARQKIITYAKGKKNIYLYDYLGVNGYYSAMKHCSYMLGNSSSGIIEAASFGCYVINIGDRQKGRICGENVFHSKGNIKSILSFIKKIKEKGIYRKKNIYYQPHTLTKIIKTLNLDK